MRAKQRQSLWLHSLYSLLMCGGLLVIVLTGHDLSTTFLALFIGVYVLVNTFIHIRRQDYNHETLYEYLLGGVAVFIVLASAVAR